MKTNNQPHYILNAFKRPYGKKNHKFIDGLSYEFSCPVQKIVMCSVKDFCAN